MKFVSWNVNGLRACIQKGFLDAFQELDADFFCLQETKLSEGQLQLSLPGYEQYWCYAEKKGYSGTAIFTKHTPLSVRYGIGVPELDHEGRVITLEYQEFYLVTCYTPNAQRGLARLDFRMQWDEAFRVYLKALDEYKPVILCGDLNVAHREIDLKNPAANRGNAGFSDEERQSFQTTLDLGFIDTFRYLHPDATGRYSWWSYMYHARENNAGWRIDYFLTSSRVQSAILRADIHDQITGSDHCPVSVELDTTVNGSIWSPAAGTPSVLTPAEKPKKTPRASAKTAKALVAFALALCILAGVGLLLSGWLGEQLVPGPIYDSLRYDVEVYPVPFGYAVSSAYSGILRGDSLGEGSGTTDNAVLAVTDTEYTYYVADPQDDSLDTANIALRVTPEIAPWALDTTWSVLLYSYEADLEELHILPYYEDVALKHQLGWLIWCRIDQCADCTLDISCDAVEEDLIQSLNLYPYLRYGETQDMTTQELAAYVVNYDYIVQCLNTLDTPYLLDVIDCPALGALILREDAVSALMDMDCDDNVTAMAIHTLLGVDVFRELMNYREEAAYITGDYPSSPYTMTSSDIASDFSDISTEDLVDMILANWVGTYLSQCSCVETANYVFESLYWDPYLDALKQRTDAPQVLLTLVRGGDREAMLLLASDLFASGLSDDELGQFIHVIFAYSPGSIPYLLGSNVTAEYADMMTTDQLIAYIIFNKPLCQRITADDLSAQSIPILCQEYPVLQELLSREDCVYGLMESVYAQGSTIADLLLATDTLRDMMSPQEEASYILCQYTNARHSFSYFESTWDTDSLTTQQIVRYLPIYDVDYLLQCSCTETAELVYTYLLDYSQLLRELSVREDAVSALMNIARQSDSLINHVLLSLEVFQSKMTPEEKASYDACDYPSFPLPAAG